MANTETSASTANNKDNLVEETIKGCRDEISDSESIDWYEKIEDVYGYKKGGYHPIHLEDILDNRFEVVHKLGSGEFGTVWLCRDITLRKWRAVKIMTAEHSTNGTEEKILDFLQDRNTLEELNDNHIVVPLERFWVEGPNGRHLCVVMPVFGWTVSNWRWMQKDHEEKTGIDAKNVCRQIIQSLGFLHGHGICHSGLTRDKILMKVEGIDDLSKDEMMKMMGTPECIETEILSGQPLTPGVPEFCVLPARESWCEGLSTMSIAVVDFDDAFFVDDPPKPTDEQSQYASPEEIFETESLGYASDIWTLACTLFEVRTFVELFNSPICSGVDIVQMEFYLGSLPELYRRKYADMFRTDESLSPLEEGEVDFFNSDAISVWDPEDLTREQNNLMETSGYSNIFEAALGHERNICDYSGDKIPEITGYRYPREDVLQLADLLQKMLKYNPAERIGIDAVQSHPWVRLQSDHDTSG